VHFEAEVEGRTVAVEVRRDQGRYRVRVGERILWVDRAPGDGPILGLIVDGQSCEVGIERKPDGATTLVDAHRIEVALRPASSSGGAGRRAKPVGPLRITAPMPGKIVKLLVSPGDEVASGAGLIVMEAMKMENELRAPRPGTIREVGVREGQAVETGALLALLE
jgi:biotin carboxyl carrier protein